MANPEFKSRPGFHATTDIALLRRASGGLQTLLILRRGPVEANRWAMPGGHIDPEDNYNLGEAAARELREETGVDIHQEPFPIALRYVGMREAPERDWIGHIFMAFVGSHHTLTVKAADDASEARWVTRQELRGLEVAFDHLEVLETIFDVAEGISTARG